MKLKVRETVGAVLLSAVSIPASSQHADHDQAQANQDSLQTEAMANTPHTDHEQMEMPMEMATEMEMSMEMDSSATMEDVVRDPHAYSGGYELATGPYTLESESQISLADTTNFVGLWVDRLEYVESHDTDAEEFEGHAWIGNSYNRVFLRSEIEVINDSLDRAEIDLLHSRAISPFWDLRMGVRRELGDEAGRNWASIGLVGLAPYWFEVDAHFFVGERGNTFFDLEAEYDMLLNQRLVLQPRIDIHAYGKTDREMGHGKGFSVVKAGFRLRYEIDRQLAPYFGVERVLKFGETADLLSIDQNRKDTHWLMGFLFWF